MSTPGAQPNQNDVRTSQNNGLTSTELPHQYKIILGFFSGSFKIENVWLYILFLLFVLWFSFYLMLCRLQIKVKLRKW